MKIGTNLALFFPILVCNQKCPYCVNHHSQEANLKYKLAPGSKWIEGINSLELIDEIKTGGGEPSLHPDFIDIFNNLKDVPKRILIGTNGAETSKEKLLKVRPRPGLHVQISFHPSETDLEPFVDRVSAIRDVHGPKNVGVHMISRNGKLDPAVVARFKEKNFDIGGATFLYDHEGFYQGALKDFSDMTKPPRRIRCPLSIYKPIAPNGNIYACHQLMYTQSDIGILGNIFSRWSINSLEIDCPMYGWCNPCDDGHFRKKDQLRTLQRERPELAIF